MGELKIGDVVTWRKATPSDAKHVPLGVAHCKILAFGESEDGKPAAMIEAMGQEVGALLADLHLED